MAVAMQPARASYWPGSASKVGPICRT